MTCCVLQKWRGSWCFIQGDSCNVNVSETSHGSSRVGAGSNGWYDTVKRPRTDDDTLDQITVGDLRYHTP